MIIGERVRLRGIEKTDLPRYVAWLNDDDVRRHLSMVVPLSMGQEEKWYEDMLKRPAEEHPLGIEVNTQTGWVLVGNVALFGIDQHARSAEMGIFIGDKNYWNQGYGREAVYLILKHGFEHLNLNRIFLRVMETNPRGIHSYEHAGFKHEGKMRQAFYQDGKYIDVLLMSILRSEWQTEG